MKFLLSLIMLMSMSSFNECYAKTSFYNPKELILVYKIDSTDQATEISEADSLLQEVKETVGNDADSLKNELNAEKAEEMIVGPNPSLEQLAPIKVTVDSIFFFTDSRIKMEHEKEGVKMRYTVDGSEVNKLSPQYNYRLIIATNANLKCRAFHPDFAPSETFYVQVRKVFNNDSIVLVDSTSTKPSKEYPAGGLSSLMDFKEGDLNIENNDRWLGFQDDEVVFNYEVVKPFFCSGISIGTLIDHEVGIFKPIRFELEVDDEIIGFLRYDQAKSLSPAELKFWDFSIRTEVKKNIKIKLVNLKEMPDWYEGSGKKPWIFVDEIIID